MKVPSLMLESVFFFLNGLIFHAWFLLFFLWLFIVYHHCDNMLSGRINYRCCFMCSFHSMQNSTVMIIRVFIRYKLFASSTFRVSSARAFINTCNLYHIPYICAWEITFHLNIGTMHFSVITALGLYYIFVTPNPH